MSKHKNDDWTLLDLVEKRAGDDFGRNVVLGFDLQLDVRDDGQTAFRLPLLHISSFPPLEDVRACDLVVVAEDRRVPGVGYDRGFRSIAIGYGDLLAHLGFFESDFILHINPQVEFIELDTRVLLGIGPIRLKTYAQKGILLYNTNWLDNFCSGTIY